MTWEASKKEKLFTPEPIQEKLLEPYEIKREKDTSKNGTREYTFDSKVENQEVNENGENLKVEYEPPKEEPKPRIIDYKIIGQIFGTYWIVEKENNMYLVDQHAAHERVLYEKLMNDFKSGEIYSQALLRPLVFEVTPKEKEAIEENKELFKRFGFLIEEFGDLAYVIRELPILFDGPVESKFFLDIVDLFLNDEYIKNAYDMKLNTIATFSCKGAVKAKDQLSISESKALIETLLTLENPYTCPHGRPTIIAMSQYELEKNLSGFNKNGGANEKTVDYYCWTHRIG